MIQCTLCYDTVESGDEFADHLSDEHEEFMDGLFRPVVVDA